MYVSHASVPPPLNLLGGGEKYVHPTMASYAAAVAAAQMRHVLVDWARKANAAKRGGGATPVTLDSRVFGLVSRAPFSMIDVDDALMRLSELDERQGRIAELHLFGALSIEEAAQAIGISVRTAFSDWRIARAWLLKELAP